MAQLNEKTDITKRNVHIMITNRCYRNCPFCCNKQYDVNDIPIVTNEELEEAENIFLTGGEPFAFADPCMTAAFLKGTYPNIKKVYVYTNAYELYEYLYAREKNLWGIDGLTISIKDKRDLEVFKDIVYHRQVFARRNDIRVYVFGDMKVDEYFKTFKREWQKEFVAAPDSIFRRVATFYEDRCN